MDAFAVPSSFNNGNMPVSAEYDNLVFPTVTECLVTTGSSAASGTVADWVWPSLVFDTFCFCSSFVFDASLISAIAKQASCEAVITTQKNRILFKTMNRAMEKYPSIITSTFSMNV